MEWKGMENQGQHRTPSGAADDLRRVGRTLYRIAIFAVYAVVVVVGACSVITNINYCRIDGGTLGQTTFRKVGTADGGISAWLRRASRVCLAV
jgi:hypothetical protein